MCPRLAGAISNADLCFIRQRGHQAENALQPQHYSEFIHSVRNLAPIYALAIQGYEPLLPASQPYTKEILATGAALGVPVNFVTNGTCLDESSNWLAAFVPANIAISLDSASAAAHDRFRGMAGAWATTIRGIERATKTLAPRTNLAVASVLMPKGCAALAGMPRLLRQLGIEHWIITPLLKVGRGQIGGPVGDRQEFYRSISRLQDAADDVGIRMTVDDELDCLGHERACRANPRLRRFHVRTIPAGVELIRLEPGGECVVGKDILRAITDATPRWQPGRIRAGDL